MVARLWWKDARQLLPIWGIIALFALAVEGVMARYFGDVVRDGGLLALALFWAALYVCLASSAAFAGEREARTMTLLDTMPAPRREVWLAKTSFALATAVALGLLLFACAGLAPDGWGLLQPHRAAGGISTELSPPQMTPVGAVGIGLVVILLVLGSGLFWSSWMKNVLLAATLALVTALLTSPVADILSWPYRSGPSAALSCLAVAMVLIALSFQAFLRSGPPARPLVARSERPLRSRRRAVAGAATGEESDSYAGRPAWGRLAAFHLAWQARREVRSVELWLVLVGLAVPWAYSFFAVGMDGGLFWGFCVVAVGLVGGLNIYGLETRSETRRFLAGHGVRPGLVWAWKLVIWLAELLAIGVTSGLLYLANYGFVGWARAKPIPANAFFSVVTVLLAALGAYLTPVAVGALSGMVFRRALTAGAIAVLTCLILWGVAVPLMLQGLLWPAYVIVVPPTILAISFLWSRDWLLDRPGLARWFKLVAMCAGATGLLLAAYVAERAWNLPELTPETKSRVLAINISATDPSAIDAAADLYRQASRAWKAPTSLAAGVATDGNAIVKEAKAGAFPNLERNRDLLPLIRKAAAMPDCRFADVNRMTMFSTVQDFPNMSALCLLLAESARERRAKGDLKGAWEDIVAVFRMARQQSGPVPMLVASSGQHTEQTALWLALNWAADAKQTSQSLQAALDEFQEFLLNSSPADPLKVEALLARNAERLSPTDFSDRVQESLGNARPTSEVPLGAKLSLDLLTTPWERARMDRVMQLYLAGAVEDANSPPVHAARYEAGQGVHWQSPGLWNGPTGRHIFPAEMDQLIRTTPLVQRLSPVTWQYMLMVDFNEATRRGLVHILALRLYQARHDGKLPSALKDLVTGKESILPKLPSDPFGTATQPFQYVPSLGQLLPLLEDFSFYQPSKDVSRPTTGFHLLYSVGPDLIPEIAIRSAAGGGRGDIVFPLPDNVPPPK